MMEAPSKNPDSTDLEMAQLPPLLSPGEAVEPVPNYPRQDGGTKAWIFLFGASIIEISAWGQFFSFDPKSTHKTDMAQDSRTVTVSSANTSSLTPLS